MYLTAKKTTEELGKLEDYSENERNMLFEMLGMGALKYFILRVDPKKNMLFNPDDSIDFNGNTGPFIQYTHARIRSLLRKAAEKNIVINIEIAELNTALGDKERSILKTLYQYPKIVAEAGKNLSPALVANYVYELAKEYNQFYQEVPVLKENDLALVELRLVLSHFTGRVIKSAMALLGIEVPEKM